MSKLKVNSITNLTETSSVILPKGATIPSGYQLSVNGGVNSSGILTASNLNLTANANVVGVLTASSFEGDGSGLTQLPSVNESKVYALRQIISFSEFSKA
tara:strand:+ start:3675 stop:3974 length:300 start_codon:yes stop_codon:yes gene_type:complete